MSSVRRVWVTRAEPGASRTAARLGALGFEPVVAPLLTIRTLTPVIDLSGVAALAFTSVNGVTAFAALNADRDKPVFAVGDATAEAAREAEAAKQRRLCGRPARGVVLLLVGHHVAVMVERVGGFREAAQLLEHFRH